MLYCVVLITNKSAQYTANWKRIEITLRFCKLSICFIKKKKNLEQLTKLIWAVVHNCDPIHLARWKINELHLRWITVVTDVLSDQSRHQSGLLVLLRLSWCALLCHRIKRKPSSLWGINEVLISYTSCFTLWYTKEILL